MAALIDSLTHTLFGFTLYGAVEKDNLSKEMKKSLMMTSVVGSLIPDIDVVSRYWDTEGMYQMWHRGLTHSIFMAPLWALLLWAICYFIWRQKDRRIFHLGLLAVFIHITSDLFNTWGTGYLEPFSPLRISFGTIPIIDFVFWGMMLLGFIIARRTRFRTYKVYRVVWLAMVLHVLIQSVQGYMIYQNFADQYEQHVVSAQFMPWHFSVIGKNDNHFEIVETTLWDEPQLQYELTSQADADLETLFSQNPKAKTLVEWSPFVVIVDDEERFGVYDPRFYRNGQSFLFEYIWKKEGN